MDAILAEQSVNSDKESVNGWNKEEYHISYRCLCFASEYLDCAAEADKSKVIFMSVFWKVFNRHT